ncbi:hypothetical protein RJ640_007600 [Escallonia rubra]|uniref:GAG-pre-integrase domain-containing protein n=1 Tax=Escallonia rubra TaxID=112253 RepID=A0AA88RS04_9ASTE|nr:hypothetical protein RJ640_007600 [Escallonia rubra]
MQVEDYLYQKDLYLPLVGEKPEAMNVNEWTVLDRKALATVRFSLTPQVAFNISKEKTTAAVMKASEKFSVMNDEIRRKTIGDGISFSTALSVESRVDDNFKVWYVDSGASIHCTPHRDCFSDYVHGDYGHVTVGNGYQCRIVGKGKVEIKLSNGGTLILNDVRHIPELQKNLISVSGLDREGYFVAFGEKQWKVTKGSMVVARGEIVRTLYTLLGTYNHSISLASTENLRTTLWHHMLGYLSESGMRILHSKNPLLRMKNIQLDFCEGCVYGKQKRVSFRKDGKERKTERLELVHTDVCGPTTVKSLGGTPKNVFVLEKFEGYERGEIVKVRILGKNLRRRRGAESFRTFWNPLGDVKDQAEDKANHKPWYTADEKSSKMSTEDLQDLIREYPLPEGWYARLPGLGEPANYGTKFETGVYEEQVKSGYRLPLHPFALRFFEHYRMAPGQLVPNGWRKLVGLIYLVQTSGYKPDVTDFMRVFFEVCFVKGVANCPGWYYIHSRQRLLKGGPKSNKGWHSRYFFVGRLDKGELPFDRVWNPYCKDFENPGKPTPNSQTKHILSHIKLRGGLCIDEPLSEEQLVGEDHTFKAHSSWSSDSSSSCYS